MENNGPPTKRAKHMSIIPEDYDMNADDNSTISGFGSEDRYSDYNSTISGFGSDDEMSDASTVEWLSKSSKSANKLGGKPFVLKVPRKYTRVPQYLHNLDVSSPTSMSERRKRSSSITDAEFGVLETMPLDGICMFADLTPDFKKIAEKYFAVKYQELQLSQLADPKSGKYTLVKVQRLLRNFGHLIWSLALNLEQLDDRDKCADLLALVRQHCSETLGWMVL